METSAVNGPALGRAAETGSSLHWLVVSRALWIALALLVLAIAFFALPLGFRLSMTTCNGSDCAGGQLYSQDARALALLGISSTAYAWTETVWAVVILFALLTVAAIIFWHPSTNRVAILASFWMLTFFPTFYDGLMRALIRVAPVLYWPVTLIEALGIWLGLVLVYLFPNGKFVPRQARFLLLPITAYASILLLFTPLFAIGSGLTPLDNLLASVYRGFLASGVIAQLYRYHLSSPVERQQTKWMLFGMAFFVLEDVLYPIWPFLFPGLAQSGFAHAVYVYLGPALAKTFLLLFTFSVAVAILRYRLWDIDLIINRTLVYIPLTALLAGIFAASVALLQRVFVAASGQGSELAAVLSTLLVVASLTPAKDRLQTVVDSHFKYANDSGRRLDAFEEQLRKRLYVIDPVQVTRRLTEEAMEAFNARGGAVFWGHEERPSHTCGEWDGQIRASAAVTGSERRYGVVALAARRNGRPYDHADRASLARAALFVAQVIEEDSSESRQKEEQE